MSDKKKDLSSSFISGFKNKIEGTLLDKLTRSTQNSKKNLDKYK